MFVTFKMVFSLKHTHNIKGQINTGKACWSEDIHGTINNL